MNKMFKKLLAATMAVSIAASMSVAFAADVTVAPTDNAVTVTPTAVENATMYTVMVFGCAADADIATATPADATAIYYINQGADVTALVSNMLVKASSETEYLPTGNYVVRIGNDQGTVQNFGLESKKEEAELVLYGDVFKDGKVNARDRATLNQRIGGKIDDTAIWFDATDLYQDGKINARDRALLNQLLGGKLTQADFPQGA